MDEVETAKMLEMSGRGASQARISQELGYAQSTISEMLRRAKAKEIRLEAKVDRILKILADLDSRLI